MRATKTTVVTSRIEYYYDTEEGRKCFHITSEVPQDSKVLKLEFPVEVGIVGFADDITLEVYGESIEEVELNSSVAVVASVYWVESEPAVGKRFPVRAGAGGNPTVSNLLVQLIG